MIRETDMSQNVKQGSNTTNNNMFPNKQTDARASKGSAGSNGSNSSNSGTQNAETQAKEKLALYVYEYLLHQGAQRAAQTFLSEIQWEKDITLGDPPGFLHNWWCVFWDLYSAAPECLDHHNHHSREAKAFHELNSGNLPSPSTYMPQQTDMANMVGMGAGGYYQHSRPPSLSNSQNQLAPGGGMLHNSYMNNRYSMGRPPNIRMPGQGMVGGQLPFSSMDPSRQQQAASYQNSSLMGAGMRGYNGIPPMPPSHNRVNSMPNGTMMGGGPMGPSSMQMGPRGPWNNPAPVPSPLTPGPPRTPILSSPQDPTTPFQIDGTDPQLSLTGNNIPGSNTLPGVNNNLPGGDLSASLSSGRSLSTGTLPDTTDSMDDLQESTESVAIQRIKESMKEEVKKFESEVPEYYTMQ